MAQGLFTAVEHVLEPEWQGEFYTRLAGLCEQVKLRDRDAQILNLYCRGVALPDIGLAMGIVQYRTAVWRCLHRCAQKLALPYRAGYEERRLWVWWLLECIRNSANPDWDCGYDPEWEPRPRARREVVNLDDLTPLPADVLTLLAAELALLDQEIKVEGAEVERAAARLRRGGASRVWSSG